MELSEDLRAVDVSSLEHVLENKVKFLFSQLSESDFNSTPPAPVQLPHPHSATKSSSTRSGTSVSESKLFAPTKSVQAAQQSAIPVNTAKNTTWALNIRKEWIAHHSKVCFLQKFPDIYQQFFWKAREWD